MIGKRANGSVAIGKNRGEYLFSDRHVNCIPIEVLGKMNQSGLPTVVEMSAMNCSGNVKLKSR
jgi:hypothetical protein